MKNYLKAVLLALLTVGFVWLMWFQVQGQNMPFLQPKGLIALQERTLFYVATLLMLLIVLPVFVLTAVISWRYRHTNTRAKYLPNWEHNLAEELIWWAVPCVIIIVLASITWKTTHDLDPFRSLPGDTVNVQVVSLNWKWLFIYQEEGVASVNLLTIPMRRPVAFSVTADSPMNSFWIPQLGGQIYSMTGMVTKLHLTGNEPGEYTGSSANISGKGFSGMTFTTKVVTQEEYDAWVAEVARNTEVLDAAAYDKLSTPSEHEPVRYYGAVQDGLFDRIVGKYSSGMPMHQSH